MQQNLFEQLVREYLDQNEITLQREFHQGRLDLLYKLTSDMLGYFLFIEGIGMGSYRNWDSPRIWTFYALIKNEIARVFNRIKIAGIFVVDYAKRKEYREGLIVLDQTIRNPDTGKPVICRDWVPAGQTEKIGDMAVAKRMSFLQNIIVLGFSQLLLDTEEFPHYLDLLKLCGQMKQDPSKATLSTSKLIIAAINEKIIESPEEDALFTALGYSFATEKEKEKSREDLIGLLQHCGFTASISTCQYNVDMDSSSPMFAYYKNFDQMASSYNSINAFIAAIKEKMKTLF